MKKTFIVTGLAGGGTSISAALLYLMGIDMGNENGAFDCPSIMNQLLSEEYKVLVNSKKKVWGFKYPMISIGKLKTIANRVTNPHFVFVFRDPIPSHKTYNTNLLYRRSNYLLDMSIYIDELKSPYIALSYERLLTNKRESVINLSKFCEIKISEKKLEECMDLIQPMDKFRKISKLWE